MQRNACKRGCGPSACRHRACAHSCPRADRVRTHRQLLFLQEVNDTSILKTARLRTDQRQLLCFVLCALCRFSDAGMTAYRCGEAAGVRKAPRHEIAVGGAPEDATGTMGIWVGRACHGDWLATVRAVASGQ